MQGARPGRHEACEIRGAMGLEMPLQQPREAQTYKHLTHELHRKMYLDEA